MLFKQKYNNIFNSRGVFFVVATDVFFLQQVSFFLQTSVSAFYRIKNKVNPKSKVFPQNQREEIKDASNGQLYDLNNDEEFANKLDSTSNFRNFNFVKFKITLS